MFTARELEYIENMEVRGQAVILNKLDKDRKNADIIIAKLPRFMGNAKDNREWFAYFTGLYYMIFYQRYYGTEKAVVQYAELFYKVYKVHFEECLLKYSGSSFARIVTITYDLISLTYADYAQITDKTIREYQEMYKMVAVRFHFEYFYWNTMLRYALLFKELPAAKQAYWELNHCKPASGCYVCFHRPYLGYYILAEQPDLAMEQIQQIISREIPKEYRWCYVQCENATLDEQYCALLEYCVDLNRPDYYREYLPPAIETMRNADVDFDDTNYAYIYATAGIFDEKSLIEAKEDGEKISEYSTVSSLKNMLTWWIYFELLYRSGGKSVDIASEAAEFPLPDADGKTDCRLLSAWYCEKADILGQAFTKSRPAFDYKGLKKSYWSCADLPAEELNGC